MRRIGIDVGGTNTDAVLLDGDTVVHSVKAPTSADVTGGIIAALAALCRHPDVARGDFAAVIIGTTHFVNAVVQRAHLTRVAAIRLGMPVSASLPPFCDWPQDLAELARGEVFMLEGGHDFDGRPIMPLDERGLRAAARRIRDSGPLSADQPSFRRSIPPVRSAQRKSFSPNVPMSRSRYRMILGASVYSNAKMRRSSMPRCTNLQTSPLMRSLPPSPKAGSKRRSISRRMTAPS
jgi:hypothetical protein